MPKENTLLTIIAIAIIAIAAVLIMNGSPSINIAADGSTQNTISVSGQGEITASPDKAEIHIGMDTEGRTAANAQEENAIKSTSVYQALDDLGFDEEDIETTQYYLQPNYNYNRETGQSYIDGYTLRHTLKVTTEDLDEIGDVLDKVVKAGANNIDNIQFGLTDETQREVNEQALAEATKSAKEKAKSLAKELGVSVGPVVSIAESNYHSVPVAMARGFSEEMAMDASVAISPKNVNTHATVSVSFAIN